MSESEVLCTLLVLNSFICPLPLLPPLLPLSLSNELKQRCFTTVKNALMWLLDPQQREPASVDNSISGWALVQVGKEGGRERG